MIVVDYNTFGTYVPTITSINDLYGCLPVWFYTKSGGEALVYKKTQKSAFFISQTSETREPKQERVEEHIDKYLCQYGFSSEIPDTGRSYLVNRTTGELLYDLDLGLIINYANFDTIPVPNLTTYLIVYTVVDSEGKELTEPAIMYEGNAGPTCLYLRYQTRKLLKPYNSTVSLGGEDLILDIFTEMYGLPAPAGALRSWAVVPQESFLVYSASQLETLMKVLSKISSGVADEGVGIVNGKYFSLKWIIEHKRLPDIDMAVIRDVQVEGDIEYYIDGFTLEGGKLIVSIADSTIVTFEKLEKALGVSSILMRLVSSNKLPLIQ